MTTYDDFQHMSYMERDAVTRLDMSRCDFRHMYVKGILRSAGSLQEVQLSDTVLDPSVKVDCMDGCGGQSLRRHLRGRLRRDLLVGRGQHTLPCL